MSEIISVNALEVLDSRGNPTIKVEVTLDSGICGEAIVPSGASTGRKEALELRDKEDKRYKGKGVLKAVNNVNQIIAPELIGYDVLLQREIDSLLCELDNKPNKSNLGANAILGVSMACARAGASALGLPLFRYLGGVNAHILPVPMMNVINGGVHSDSGLSIQEFMIVPIGASSFAQAVRMGSEVFHTLKEILKKNNLSISVGDEGGFAPKLKSTDEALKLILEAISEAGYIPHKDVALAIDVAATGLYKGKAYFIKDDGKDLKFKAKDLTDFYSELVDKYNLISIEDGMAEDDWKGWELLTEKLGDKIQLVGDDVFVTNILLLKEGIEREVANAILIKPNQIGTVSETLDTVETAKWAGYGIIISHRSGETEDTFIADLAVAVNSGQIKTGSLCRSERISKYNRLMQIELMLGDEATFPSKSIYPFLDK